MTRLRWVVRVHPTRQDRNAEPQWRREYSQVRPQGSLGDRSQRELLEAHEQEAARASSPNLQAVQDPGAGQPLWDQQSDWINHRGQVKGQSGPQEGRRSLPEPKTPPGSGG